MALKQIKLLAYMTKVLNMTAKDIKTICDEMAAHISKGGGLRKSWYVGITADIPQRLHGDHRVPKLDHWFIWREAYSSDEARAIEQAFLDLGCDGGPGGGDHTARFVYAYLKRSVTKP